MSSFGSKDFLDDAVESLSKSDFPFVMFVGTSPEHTTIESIMTDADKELFFKWLKDGTIEQWVRECWDMAD